MDQQQKIQRYIIKSAPYGQLKEVLKQLEIVSKVDVNSQHIYEAVQQFNEQHLALFGDPQNPQLLISGLSRIGQNLYVDQATKTQFKVNHFTNQILSKDQYEYEMMEEVNNLLKQLTEQIKKYVNLYFKKPNGYQVFVQVDQETGLTVHVSFTSKNISLSNQYTGQWLSQWQVTKQSIKGQVSIRTHFFQTGNVQLNQKRQIEKQFNFVADMKESAKKIVQIISKSEKQIQSGLGEIYEKMPTNFFKNLRRVVPYTKNKMVWNINSVKMNQNLKQLNK